MSTEHYHNQVATLQQQLFEAKDIQISTGPMAQQKWGTESCLLQARQSLAQNTKAAPRIGALTFQRFCAFKNWRFEAKRKKFSELSIKLSYLIIDFVTFVNKEKGSITKLKYVELRIYKTVGTTGQLPASGLVFGKVFIHLLTC